MLEGLYVFFICWNQPRLSPPMLGLSCTHFLRQQYSDSNRVEWVSGTLVQGQQAKDEVCQMCNRQGIQKFSLVEEESDMKRNEFEALDRENGRNVTSFRAWPLWPATWVGYELGGSVPHQCR